MEQMIGGDAISETESRLNKRIAAPVGTTALIRNKDGYLDTLYVKDLSVFGILANGYLTAPRYPVDTVIKGILLTIPPCELGLHDKVSLLVNEGRVIHTLVDQVTRTVCYGIEFLHERGYVYETLERLVKKIKPRPLI